MKFITQNNINNSKRTPIHMLYKYFELSLSVTS